MQTTVVELWDDFTYYRSKTAHVQEQLKQHPYMRPMKPTPERLALFSRLVKWCQSRDIHVRQWLFTLFAVRRWRFAPQLQPGHLMSEKHIPRYHKFTDYSFYAKRMQELEAQKRVQETRSVLFDPNRDVVPSVEEAKRSYLQSGNLAGCMDAMKSETFGYHPKSAVCNGCSARALCAEKLQLLLPFDVGALRRGEITAQDARDLAMTGIQGYGSK